MSKEEDFTASLDNLFQCSVTHTVVFSEVQRESCVSVHAYCLRSCQLKRSHVIAYSELNRQKIIHVFHSSVQLKSVARYSPWQNLWFVSRKERHKSCSSCWTMLSTASHSQMQGLGLDMSLIPKVWNITFSQCNKNFSFRTVFKPNKSQQQIPHKSLKLNSG